MHVIPEWLELVSLVFCTGAIICRLWVLSPATESGFSYREGFVSGMWKLFCFGIAVLTAGSIIEFLTRTSEITGQPFPSYFPAVPTVLFKTHYGHVWIVRMLALGLLALSKTVVRYRDKRPFLLFMLLLALVVSATASASGHASDSGDLSLPEIADWLHLLAVCFWGGGLMVLWLFVLPDFVKSDAAALPVVSHTAVRFSTIAGISVGVVALSAIYNFWFYVRYVDALWKTSYGLAVIVKTVLFLVLICLGAINRYVMVPLLTESAGLAAKEKSVIGRFTGKVFTPSGPKPDAREVLVRFRRRVGIEALLIVGVLFCAALLRHEIPARHMVHMDHIIEDGTFHRMDHGPH